MRRNKRKLLTAKAPSRPRLRNAIRWVLYILCIFLAFVTANSGDYTKPLLLIPIALCISSVSGIVTSAIVGSICGFLLDISCGTLPGYHAIELFLICMLISRLYDRLMQQRFFNLVFFTAVTAFFLTGTDFIFQYALWGHDHVSQIYLHYSLKCLLYTTISSAVCYPIFYCIHRYLLPQRRRTVEKTLKPMEDSEL